MFSGHTATYVLLTLFSTHYLHGQDFGTAGQSNALDGLDSRSVVQWLACFTGIFLILSTRFHYSSDVFIAFAIAMLAFHLYHYYILTVCDQRTWAAAFVRWFECVCAKGSAVNESTGIVGPGPMLEYESLGQSYRGEGVPLSEHPRSPICDEFRQHKAGESQAAVARGGVHVTDFESHCLLPDEMDERTFY